MKKIILSIAMTFVFASTAFAVCDVQKATTDFTQFMKKVAQENPMKFAQAQGEYKTLMTEISTLTQAGKVDEICKKYEDFQKKF